jgi:hypothetical protein
MLGFPSTPSYLPAIKVICDIYVLTAKRILPDGLSFLKKIIFSYFLNPTWLDQVFVLSSINTSLRKLITVKLSLVRGSSS